MKKLVALVLPLLLLSGCAEIDDAQAKLEGARLELDEARSEAQQAKDRFERVRSATIIREEAVELRVQPLLPATELTFAVAAERSDGTSIPPENLTRVPSVLIEAAGFRVTCDPLACAVTIPAEGANVTWADGTDGRSVVSPDRQTICVSPPDGPHSCGAAPLAPLKRAASVLATTAVADVSA